MRKAFTMIELLFAIVIIGILAAVAIPKLAATRDDAYVVKTAQLVGQAVQEISEYSTSKGVTLANWAQMSNAVGKLINTNQATQNGNVLNIKMHGVNDCLKLKVVTNNIDTNLTVAYGNAGGDEVCSKLQNIVRAQQYTVPLGGVRLKL